MDPVIPIDSEGKIIMEDEFGKLKYYTKNLKKGEYTDDTILTLAIAESIGERGRLDIDDVSCRQLDAYEATLDSNGKSRYGFGGTTQKAFKKMRNGYSAFESGIENGLGNGPAMKMHPIGMCMHANHEYRYGLMFAEAVGKSTHLDPRSIAGGIVQAAAVYSMLKDESKYEFMKEIVDVCRRHEKPLAEDAALKERGNLLSKLEWIVENRHAEPEKALEHLGNGSLAFESHPFALFMFQKYWDKPIEGLIETVNYGGDCDTTGAIYGALCGAKNGMIFPQRWIDCLKDYERIREIADKLWDFREYNVKKNTIYYNEKV